MGSSPSAPLRRAETPAVTAVGAAAAAGSGAEEAERRGVRGAGAVTAVGVGGLLLIPVRPRPWTPAAWAGPGRAY